MRGRTVRLTGAATTAAVLLYDALGRVVGAATADLTGAATLPTAELLAGLYVVRTGRQPQRLVVD